MLSRSNRAAWLFLPILAALPACGGGKDPAPSGSGGANAGGGASSSANSSSSTSGTGGAGQGGAGQGGAGQGGAGQGGMGGCTPGQTVSCYSGPSGTLGVGICAAGTATCLPDGSAWSACDGEILPQIEHAGTAEDENCSGADECAGNVLWAFRLGTDVLPPSPPQYEERLFDAVVTNTGDTLISGWVYDTHTYAQGKTVGPGSFILHVDPQGVGKSAITTFPAYVESHIFAAPDGGFFLYWDDLPNGFNPVNHHLARYDAADQLQYEKIFAAPTLRFNSLAFEPNGNIMVAGSWRGAAVLDAFTIQGPIEMDYALLAELDTSGTVLWVKTFQGIDRAEMKSVLLDPSGDLFISGDFGGYHVAGSIGIGGNTFNAPSSKDSFYGRLTASGQHLWSYHVAKTGSTSANFSALTPEGGLLLVGGGVDSTGSIDLGAGAIDVEGARFLGRIDNAGAPHATVVSKSIQFGGLSPIPGGAIHFVSSFQSQNPVDVLGQMAKSHSGSPDFLIGTIGATDKLQNACIYGSALDESGGSAGRGPDGAYIIVGQFGASLKLGNISLTSVGAPDFFVAKIKP